MEIVDTHSHLYLESFDDDREQVIRNAINLGVNHFFIPAIDSRYYIKPTLSFCALGLCSGNASGIKSVRK